MLSLLAASINLDTAATQSNTGSISSYSPHAKQKSCRHLQQSLCWLSCRVLHVLDLLSGRLFRCIICSSLCTVYNTCSAFLSMFALHEREVQSCLFITVAPAKTTEKAANPCTIEISTKCMGGQSLQKQQQRWQGMLLMHTPFSEWLSSAQQGDRLSEPSLGIHLPWDILMANSRCH